MHQRYKIAAELGPYAELWTFRRETPRSIWASTACRQSGLKAVADNGRWSRWECLPIGDQKIRDIGINGGITPPNNATRAPKLVKPVRCRGTNREEVYYKRLPGKDSTFKGVRNWVRKRRAAALGLAERSCWVALDCFANTLIISLKYNFGMFSNRWNSRCGPF